MRSTLHRNRLYLARQGRRGARPPQKMDWIVPLSQALATVLSAVVIYVGQLLVKLAEPALALRALIGKIAGDL
jgi:hypothetical protein